MKAEQGLEHLIRTEHPNMLDELSPFAPAGADVSTEDLLAKTLVEFDAVRKIERRGISTSLSNPDRFLTLLGDVHQSVGGGGSALRRGPVFIRPDSKGNVISFPPAEMCEPLLRALSTFIEKNIGRFPGLCIIVAYVGIIHAHPYRDANGRTARVIANILLRQRCAPSHFMPLSKLALVSQSGFLIKLRRALYGGDWQPLLDFWIEALRLSIRLQTV